MVRDGPSFFQNKACTCWVMSSYSRTQVWKVQRWLSVLRYSTPQKCLSSVLIPVFQVMGTLCDKRGVYLFYKRQFWFRTPSTGLCDPEMLCPIVMNLWHTKNSVFSLETGSPAYHNVYSIHSQESRGSVVVFTAGSPALGTVSISGSCLAKLCWMNAHVRAWAHSPHPPNML